MWFPHGGVLCCPRDVVPLAIVPQDARATVLKHLKPVMAAALRSGAVGASAQWVLSPHPLFLPTLTP